MARGRRGAANGAALAIHVETEVFSLDDAPKAYEKMHVGQLRGRAVIVPLTMSVKGD